MRRENKSMAPDITQGLSDHNFANKLDNMGSVKGPRHHGKESMYDYQKIQSTAHGSQFLGQRHFMGGGPTSGYHSMFIQRLHRDQEFKRSSPSPNKVFDEVRGASSEINSYNNLQQFMPSKDEESRLKVLKNFKDISRIMTTNFLKNNELKDKYKSRVPDDVKQKQMNENVTVSTMTNIMKKMHSPRSFNSPIRKFGSVQNYQNVSLAKNLMKQQERSVGGLAKTKMSSLLNDQSAHDKLYQSTVDATFRSGSMHVPTEIDLIDQKHNVMNLTLGKPTQSLKGSIFKQKYLRLSNKGPGNLFGAESPTLHGMSMAQDSVLSANNPVSARDTQA